MTKMNEFNHWGETDVYWFPCEAGCNEFVSVSWDDVDTDFRILGVSSWYVPKGWKRFVYAWRALFGQMNYNGSVLLNDEAIAGLKEVLSKHD